MNYKVMIHKKPSNKTGLTVMVDNLSVFEIPAVIKLAMSNKEDKYYEYLSDRLYKEEDKQELLNYMVFLHSKAIEYGAIKLVCTCRSDFHAKAIKRLIEENKETFGTLVPYLFPKASGQAPSTDTEDMLPITSNNNNNLSEDDWKQIQALMNAKEVKEVTND